MPKPETHTREKWYYLALQDGRADNEEYATEKQAQAALNKLKEKRGVYVTHYWKDV